MDINIDTIRNAIFFQREHPVVRAFFDWKREQNRIPTETELISLLKLIGQDNLLEEYDFFLQVWLHRNEHIYCFLDSIQGKLDWYMNNHSRYNLIRHTISSIDSGIITGRFEALAYLKSAYEVSERFFPRKKKTTKSAISFAYEMAKKEMIRLKKNDSKASLEYEYYNSLVLRTCLGQVKKRN